MPPDGEEVGRPPDPGASQDCFVGLADGAFHIGGRGDEVVTGCAAPGFWESREVEFPVDRQRERIQRDDVRGHSMWGKFGPGALQHGTGGDPGGSDVHDESRLARLVLTDHHVNLLHPLDGTQHGGDLARLHPKAAQLDLFVAATAVDQLSCTVPAHHITGAVDPFPAAIRVGDEAGRGQACAIAVAESDTGAPNVELTVDPDRDRS